MNNSYLGEILIYAGADFALKLFRWAILIPYAIIVKMKQWAGHSEIFLGPHSTE